MVPAGERAAVADGELGMQGAGGLALESVVDRTEDRSQRHRTHLLDERRQVASDVGQFDEHAAGEDVAQHQGRDPGKLLRHLAPLLALGDGADRAVIGRRDDNMALDAIELHPAPVAVPAEARLHVIIDDALHLEQLARIP